MIISFMDMYLRDKFIGKVFVLDDFIFKYGWIDVEFEFLKYICDLYMYSWILYYVIVKQIESDFKFFIGEQWDFVNVECWKCYYFFCLVFNRLLVFVLIVLGECYYNQMFIKVYLDKGGIKEVVEFWQGLIWFIEKISKVQ